MLGFGIIYSIDINKQVFSLRDKKGLRYFYIPKNIFKRLKKYLYEGNYVEFIYDEECYIKSDLLVFQVKLFKEISVPSNARRTKLYSKRENNIQLKNFLNKMDNLMFIDLEMTMPDYDERRFTSELIQASYLITDSNLNIIEKRDFHILPTINNYINKRTSDFLHISWEDLETSGVVYKMFYDVFKGDIEKYSPTIVIFGKNDKSFLESSYKVNKVESLNSKLRFVNLNQLLKTYFDMSSDPGLFKSYEMLWNETLPEQKHDSYEDAYYTYKVYQKFKQNVEEEI